MSLAGADVVTPRDELDFGALEVPVIDAERGRNRWLELDVETSLYLMNIPFCLFTTESEYARAVKDLLALDVDRRVQRGVLLQSLDRGLREER